MTGLAGNKEEGGGQGGFYDGRALESSFGEEEHKLERGKEKLGRWTVG